MKYWQLLKKNKTTIVFTAATLLLLVIYISMILSNNLGSGKKNIPRIYFADNISPALQSLIDRFNQNYQGQIEVVPINLPFSKFSTNERKELLARSLRSKSDLIDVYNIIKESDGITIREIAIKLGRRDNEISGRPGDLDKKYGLVYHKEGEVKYLPNSKGKETCHKIWRARF